MYSKRKQLLDDLTERRGYCKLKEEALDRTLWRTRFARGYRPVVRQYARKFQTRLKNRRVCRHCNMRVCRHCNMRVCRHCNTRVCRHCNTRLYNHTLLCVLNLSVCNTYYNQLVHCVEVQCNNSIKLTTCFGVTSHHPQSRHTEHLNIHLKIHRPSCFGVRYKMCHNTT